MYKYFYTTSVFILPPLNAFIVFPLVSNSFASPILFSFWHNEHPPTFISPVYPLLQSCSQFYIYLIVNLITRILLFNDCDNSCHVKRLPTMISTYVKNQKDNNISTSLSLTHTYIYYIILYYESVGRQ